MKTVVPKGVDYVVTGVFRGRSVHPRIGRWWASTRLIALYCKAVSSKKRAGAFPHRLFFALAIVGFEDQNPLRTVIPKVRG